MKTAVFRVDASLDIGAGHVARCLVLADALMQKGVECRFITRAHAGHMADPIAAKGFEVTMLPAPQGPAPQGPPDHAPWAGVSWEQDAAETREALGPRPPDWLVLDHYAFDARWQKAVSPAGARLMVLDDLADRPHACDLLLDQNLGRVAEDYDGLAPEQRQRLIGPQYALLRSEFADLRAEALAARAGRDPRHLLVTMGGVDVQGVTPVILKALADVSLPEDLEATIIMGRHAPALEQVRALAQALTCPVEVVVDATDMAARMAAADIAISASGLVSYELACMGVPMLLLPASPIQEKVARELTLVTESRLIEGWKKNPAERIGGALTAFLMRLARLPPSDRRFSEIFDGAGTKRVITAMSEHHNAP